MKIAEEILMEQRNAQNYNICNYISPNGSVWKMIITAIKQAQSEAIDETVKACAEAADWECTEDCVIVRGDIFINKDSILKVAEQLKSKL